METPYIPQSVFAEYDDSVYEPAEDTFLLLDALELDLDIYKNATNPIIALECGSGSGTVITAFAKSLGSEKNLLIATDININACKITKRCAQLHKQKHVEVVNTDLAASLVDRLEKSVDVLIFNPPYVPTEVAETQGENSINLAWAGGRSGRMLIDKFLASYVPRLLKEPDGAAYLVTLDRNNTPELLDFLIEDHSIKGTIVIQRRAGQELLFVIKYRRIKKESGQ